MANQIYSCNFRLENFSGWNNITPDYDSVVSSDTSEQNKLGYIVPSSTEMNGNSLVLGCLKSILDNQEGGKINDIWIAWQDVTINSGVANTELVQVLINGEDSSGNPSYLFITKSNILNSYSVTLNFYINSTIEINTPIFSVTINDGSTKVIRLNYLQIIGAGTDSATINFWTQTASDYTTLNQLENYTGDLTSFQNISSYSYHRTMTGTNSNNYLYYMMSSNFRLLKMVFNYEVASSIGKKYNQWSGDISTFSTYPVKFDSYGTGIYTTSTNVKETFSFGNVTQKQGFTPAAVIFSSALVSGIDVSNPEVSDVICDAAQDATTETKTVSKTGTGLTWNYVLDPITSKRWTINTINTYELGINRIS